MINSYRRYLKELGLFVSDKNKDLYQKIQDIETIMVSREEFLIDFDMNISKATSLVSSKAKAIKGSSDLGINKLSKTLRFKNQ